MDQMTQHQNTELTPCWYVKDFADGWIKFYDVDMAIAEAKASGAIMRYSENGAYPDRTQPSEMPVAEKVREALKVVKSIRRIDEDGGSETSVNHIFDHIDTIIEALALLDQQDSHTGNLERQPDDSGNRVVPVSRPDQFDSDRPNLTVLLSFVQSSKVNGPTTPPPKEVTKLREYKRGHNAACDKIIAEIEKMTGAT